MAVRVTQDGVLVQRVVRWQESGGEQVPICMGEVAVEGDTFPDDQMLEHVLEYARNGERGLEYVEDSELEAAAAAAEEPSEEPKAQEPVEGYDELSSADAHAAYESEPDEEVRAAILEYELANRNRAWAQKAQAAQVGGSFS